MHLCIARFRAVWLILVETRNLGSKISLQYVHVPTSSNTLGLFVVDIILAEHKYTSYVERCNVMTDYENGMYLILETLEEQQALK